MKIFRYLLIITLIPILIYSIQEYLARSNGKYDYFSLFEIKTVERVFDKHGKKVHLIGMMHIGSKEYYENITNREKEYPLETRRTSLLEGISFKETPILKKKGTNSGGGEIEKKEGKEGKEGEEGIDYSDISKSLGLESQIDYEGNFPNSEYADVNFKELSEKTRENMLFLQNKLNLLSSFLTARPTKNSMALYLREIKELENSGINIIDLFNEDGEFKKNIIYLRNDRLWKSFKEKEDEYDVFYIPWGSAHLKDIEKRLLREGYKKTQEKTYVSVKILSVLKKSLTSLFM